MTPFEIITDVNKINLKSHWKATSVKNTNQFKENGEAITTNYSGRSYQIIAEYERNYSLCEKVIRCLKGIWLMISSFGKEWNSEAVKKLFNETKEIKRFAILVNQDPKPAYHQDVKENDKDVQKSNKKAEESQKPSFKFTVSTVLHQHILSYLKSQDLYRCHYVAKSWKKESENQELWKSLLPKTFSVFGKEEWKPFGDVGPVPPLPEHIYKILQLKSYSLPGKRICDMHQLVLIPETIDGEKCNLNYLIKQPLLNILDQNSQPDTVKEETQKTQWLLISHNPFGLRDLDSTDNMVKNIKKLPSQLEHQRLSLLATTMYHYFNKLIPDVNGLDYMNIYRSSGLIFK